MRLNDDTATSTAVATAGKAVSTQVTVTLKKAPLVPVEAEALTPENVVGKSEREIALLPLLVGNRWETVADWFRVSVADASADAAHGGPADLLVEGDLARFKRLGEGMSGGRMIVDGPVGFHAGARMSGGSLIIHGNAADFLGAQMSDGLIVVHGNAGHYTAAAYRGETRGMKGGTIVVTGNAGQMVGARMRRGLVYVLGDCGDAPAFNMKAGTVVIGGTPGIRVGARMVRGTVILLGEPTAPLPTFYRDCTYRPVFWRFLHRHLADLGFAPEAGLDTAFVRYNGDANEGGRGEMLVRVRQDGAAAATR
jgi:formylmethanofuran dehydrogenase subunit C